MVRGGDGGDGGGGEACGVRVGGESSEQYVAAVFVLVVQCCVGAVIKLELGIHALRNRKE